MAECPYFGVCGGCSFQDIPYERQAEAKENSLKGLFGELEGFHPAKKIYGYRNRMDFVCSFGSIGFRKKGGYEEAFDVERCAVMHPSLNDFFADARKAIKESGVELYDYLAHRGFLRYAVIRGSERTGEKLANFVVKEREGESVAKLKEAVNSLNGNVVFSHNPGLADVSFGEAFWWKGNSGYRETLGGKRFFIPANSFFQTNPEMAELLFKRAMEEVEGKCLDLFCGVGTISLLAAGNAGTVVGVELDGRAVEAARMNAEDNGVKNAAFLAGDAKDVLKELGEFDTVILDPPRSGLSKKIIRRADRLKPKKILYISCNPITQKRDFSWFSEYGWKPSSITGYDFFPHTPHMETFATLEKRL